MKIEFHAMPTSTAAQFHHARQDDYGNPIDKVSSDGSFPCRLCCQHIPKGKSALILAYRPFAGTNPYAETGPVFLCAAPCTSWSKPERIPDFGSATYLLRGYCASEQIVYGTGQIVHSEAMGEYAKSLLRRAHIVWVDIRSARNNCFLGRLKRASH